jgi:hypothetical protein
MADFKGDLELSPILEGIPSEPGYDLLISSYPSAGIFLAIPTTGVTGTSEFIPRVAIETVDFARNC